MRRLHCRYGTAAYQLDGGECGIAVGLGAVTTDRRVPGAAVPLAEAVERFRAEPGSWANSYAWWRTRAQESGHLTFGNSRQLVTGASNAVEVFKVGNRWMVDATSFAAALAEHRAAADELRFITDEYDQHRMLVGVGQSLRTSWGSYRVLADFHVAATRSFQRWDGGGESWICNRCWTLARLEHDRPECHTCSDWGGCSGDCTLSAVVCDGCDKRLAI